MENQTGIKNMAKRAKGRLSNGFWLEYLENVDGSAEDCRCNADKSEILNYYRDKAAHELSDSEDERFYRKVKYILDTYGDVCDMIGRLCDNEKMAQLDFIARERYVFETSNKYLECRERYEKEKKYEEKLRKYKEAVEQAI